MKIRFDGSVLRRARRLSMWRAFTLIELFVVITMVVIVAALILPRLAGSGRAPVTQCVFNFKQWVTMANVYASDNKKGSLPAFGAIGSDGNPWDVSTDFITAMLPYGMTVPMYYCPVRSKEFEADNKKSIKNNLGPITSLDTLQQFLLRYHQCKGGVVLNHAYWVPRQSSATSQYPGMDTNHCTWQGSVSTALNNSGPNTNSDGTVNGQLLITDKCGNGLLFSPTSVASTNVDKISPNTGHFFRGTYSSCNLGYLDGHVETHPRAWTQWQYVTGGGQAFWFY
ncbi:MAG: type II secretion system protein [Verrucomicrobiota bacterium]|jgi:prepilin-type processing-associated H-X9-DG protein